MRLVTLRQATIRHSGAPALENVDFHIDKGEIVTILGPNGSGKRKFVSPGLLSGI